MKITIFRPIVRDSNWSMRVCADGLVGHLRSELRDGDSIGEFGASADGADRGMFHYRKYLKYQWEAFRRKGDVNHITDHSYGHLVFSLDPRRTVVTFHDAVLMRLMDRTLSARSYPRWRILAQRYSFKGIERARKVIAVSHASKEDFLRYAGRFDPGDVEVIHNGIDTAFGPARDEDRLKVVRERCRLDPGLHYVLHVGHNGFYKNVEGLFRALSELEDDVHLLKVGSLFDRDQARKLVRYGLSHRVHVIENASRLDMPVLYHVGTLLLFPSIHEGFGLPVLEAMACGTPVICSDIPVLREVASDAALFYHPRDHQGMAEGVRRLIADNTLRGGLVQRGLERASAFGWDRCARAVYRIYRKIHDEQK